MCVHAAQVVAWASRAAVALLAAADYAATLYWGGHSPGIARVVRLLRRSVLVVVCQGAGVPNSMGSCTQGGRFVSGLALAPRPVNRTAACQRGVHRWHAFPGVSVGQGRGPCHPGVSGQRAASSRGAFGCRLVRGARSGAAWCAVLSPSPPGARAEGRVIQGCLRAPPGARCSVRPLLEG